MVSSHRRDFLRSTAVIGGIVGIGASNVSASSAQDDGGNDSDGGDDGGDVVQTFELIGERSGWEGVAPAAIEGETNPTLELEDPEGRYRIEWENGDGIGHNFAISDVNGERVVSTEVISNGSQTVEFDADEAMVEYLCEPHPASMNGDINIVGVEPPEPDDDGGDGDDGGNESDGGSDPLDQLQEESDFVFEGYTADGWQGVAPDAIADERNPTLEVEDGEEYTIGWVNGDGDPHNIAIWDADDQSLESTDNLDEEGATQTLTFEASAETASYVCEIHPNTMIGELDVQGADQSDDGGSDGGSGDDGDSGSGDGGEGDDGGSDGGGDSIPGFGVLTALAGAGAGAAAAANRLRSDTNEE